VKWIRATGGWRNVNTHVLEFLAVPAVRLGEEASTLFTPLVKAGSGDGALADHTLASLFTPLAEPTSGDGALAERVHLRSCSCGARRGPLGGSVNAVYSPGNGGSGRRKAGGACLLTSLSSYRL